MVLGASPVRRVLVGWDMALTHCCRWEVRIWRIGTSAKVTESAAWRAASVVPRSHTCRPDHSVNHVRKVILPAAGST
jgi:hypothetical protein